MASASALLISLLAVLAFAHVAYGCGINIVNSCPYTVTTCAQSSQDPIYQYQLGSGAQQYLDFGSACHWPAGGIWASVTGQCANPIGSRYATDRNLADLAEFTIGPGIGVDTYDLSNVNAYTIGLSIAVISSAGGECSTVTCAISDIRSFCQGDNVLHTLPSGALSCVNTDGPGQVSTQNTRYFNTACPQAFSYSTDNSKQVTCNTGSIYQVTICPGGITLPMNQSRVDLDH
jgi:hypothetical protein